MQNLWHSFHIQAVQRLDPLSQQALLNDQLNVVDLVFSRCLLFFFLLVLMHPTVKRARAHTYAVLSAVYLSYLFSELLLFSKLCSNSGRIIYYDKSLL